MKREQSISPTGFYVFGALALVMVIAKFTIIHDWSWWRVGLPLIIFVGFNALYITVGFIYLTFARIPERPDGDEAAIMVPYEFSVHHIASMIFFVIFADNALRWLEANSDTYWFWLFSGQGQTVLIFGGLSMVAQFWYWSTLGRALKKAS